MLRPGGVSALDPQPAVRSASNPASAAAQMYLRGARGEFRGLIVVQPMLGIAVKSWLGGTYIVV
jgi:hypothetical protein